MNTTETVFFIERLPIHHLLHHLFFDIPFDFPSLSHTMGRLSTFLLSNTASTPLTVTIITYIATLYTLVYSISTIVYIRHLHNVPDTTPCSAVLPNVREFLRIGGWILLVFTVLVTLYYGWTIGKLVPALIQHPVGWLLLLLFVASIALSFAVPIISIQYTNRLREASSVAPNDTSVKRCLHLAPYRRRTMDAVAWLNLMVPFGMVGGGLLL